MTRIFVLIDALGWAYLKDRDFLPNILTYRTEVQTVLGFSSGAIPEIRDIGICFTTIRQTLLFAGSATSNGYRLPS